MCSECCQSDLRTSPSTQVRGDYAWLGHGWIGCADAYPLPPQLTVDYGVPLTTDYNETAPSSGVFSREWSGASVRFDCNSWVGTVSLKPEQV